MAYKVSVPTLYIALRFCYKHQTVIVYVQYSQRYTRDTAQIQFVKSRIAMSYTLEFYAFYVHGSVHRWSTSVLIIVHRDATQSSLSIILQVHATFFGCQPHTSSGVHKTLTTASGTGHIFCAATNSVTLEGGSCIKNMTSTGGCSYSFVYSWWWVWLTPETCRQILRNNK